MNAPKSAEAKPRSPSSIKSVSATLNTPLKPLTTSATLKFANTAVLKAGLPNIFKTATPLMTWGFKAANNTNLGKLKAGPGLGVIDFDASTVEVLPVDTQTFPRPLTLNVTVPKGYFYVVDVYCTPSKTTNFFATSNRTTSGANYTTQYSMTLDTQTRHFLFVVQAHGTADGSNNSYRIEVGADQPWVFEKIELTKLE